MDFNYLPRTLALVSLTSLLHASQADTSLNSLTNRIVSLEESLECSPNLNTAARPPLSECSNLFITGDFLWWEAHETGLDFVIKNEEGTSFINNGKINNPKSPWHPGFRVGLGYNLPHDGWDIYANLMRFYTRGKGDRTEQPLGGAMYATWLDPHHNDRPSPTELELHDAKSLWKLHLNQIDLSLGREFFVSRYVTLRPHLGIRTAWVRQKYAIHYRGHISDPNAVNFNRLLTLGVPTHTQVRMSNRYWGLGPVGGINSQWEFWGGFSFYGDLDLALLYGFFRNDQFQKALLSETSQFRIKNRFHLGRAISDLAAGLRWQSSLGDWEDPYSFNLLIQVGWEHHIYYGQNLLFRPVDNSTLGHMPSNLGDLTLQGWTLSMKFDF